MLTRFAQLFIVLLSAYALKLHYSVASANQLRWILAPTTFLVELVSGRQFAFESHAGYMSSDHTFLIAASCAGVNFLMTAFLMLMLRRLWADRSRNVPWTFLPVAALTAFIATLLANTVRISIALQMPRAPLEAGWLSQEQFHRLEGIGVYFGFLLVLFVAAERWRSNEPARSFTGPRQSDVKNGPGYALFGSFNVLFPLIIYYATTLVIPLLNGAYNRAPDFWEYSVFVLVAPIVFLLPVVALRAVRYRRTSVS
jgi:exosortase K